MSDFDAALLATLMEDAAGKPCVGCGVPARYAVVWFPTPECLRRDFKIIDDGRGRTVVYPLCGRCGRKTKRSKAFLRKIEEVMIATLRGRL